jgi:hypothetical protein
MSGVDRCPKCQAAAFPALSKVCTNCHETFPTAWLEKHEAVSASRSVAAMETAAREAMAKPLFDPLLLLRVRRDILMRYLVWIPLVFECICILTFDVITVGMRRFDSMDEYAAIIPRLFIGAVAIAALNGFLLLSFTRFLPRRPPNVLYLRSFRFDPQTLEIRNVNGARIVQRLSVEKCSARRGELGLV